MKNRKMTNEKSNVTEISGSRNHLRELLFTVREIVMEDMPSAVSPVRLYEETNGHVTLKRLRTSRVSLFMKSLIQSSGSR